MEKQLVLNGWDIDLNELYHVPGCPESGGVYGIEVFNKADIHSLLKAYEWLACPLDMMWNVLQRHGWRHAVSFPKPAEYRTPGYREDHTVWGIHRFKTLEDAYAFACRCTYHHVRRKHSSYCTPQIPALHVY
jgi:hypothetical protein